ncbi:MAG: winged helix-turn-helix transcriptional regulator [Ruminococcaceae bacterium]|nr:winged helix-turn-helix transcriptional regulator [Oscillospiraceae bacterium]
MFDPKEILHSAFAIKKAYDSIWNSVMEKYSLTRAEIDVLAFLKCNPNHDTSRDIVEYKMTAKSHVSKAVENLMSRGYIIRIQDEDDKRVIHLKLTEESDSAVAEIKSIQADFAEKISDGITPEERAAFHSIAKKLCINAEKML